jgi:hypothetical protein
VSWKLAVDLFAMKDPLENHGVGFEHHAYAITPEAGFEAARIAGHPLRLPCFLKRSDLRHFFEHKVLNLGPDLGGDRGEVFEEALAIEGFHGALSREA